MEPLPDEAVSPEARGRRPRVALILMPWVSALLGSAALGTLKSYLRRNRVRADCYYFNVRLARKLGLRVYDYIANYGGVGVGLWLGEWLFARQVFRGQPGVEHRFEEMMRRPQFAERVRELMAHCNVGERELAAWMDETIPEFLDECVEETDWSSYDLIGFSDRFWSNTACLALAKRIRARAPAARIVFGGPNAHDEMGLELLRSFPWIDYAVDGEGERALLALSRNLAAGKPFEPVTGVSFRRGGEVTANLRTDEDERIPLDELPCPDYTDFMREFADAGFTGEAEPRLLFEGSRGCWFGAKSRCTFCGFGKTMLYASKSPDKLVREILHLHKKHRATRFNCTDDIMDWRYFDTFLPMLRDRIREGQLDLTIMFEVKANLKKAQLALLAQAGVRDITPGIESFHPEVLALMRKGVRPVQNAQTLKFAREYGIDVGYSLLYGFPGEKASYYEEMLAALPLLSHLQPPIAVIRIRGDRFSPMHSRPSEHGIGELRPQAPYSYSYPRGTRLDRLAYFFDVIPSAPAGDPETYAQPLRTFVERWRASFKYCFCYHLKGVGFTDVHDFRLLSPGDKQPTYRRIRLLSPHSEILAFCESCQSLPGIVRRLRELKGERLSAARIQAAVEELVSAKLLYQDGEQFLSLPLSAASQDPFIHNRVNALRFLARMTVLGERPAESARTT